MFASLLQNLAVSLLAKSLAAPPRLTTSGNATWAKAYWAFNPARGLAVYTPPPQGLPKVKIPVVGVHQMLAKIPKCELKLRATLPVARRAAAKCPWCAFASAADGVDAVVHLIHAQVSIRAVGIALRPLVGVLDALVRPVVIDVLW